MLLDKFCRKGEKIKMINNYFQNPQTQWGFQQPGAGYAQAPAPVMNSTLTIEEQDMLRKKKPQFTGKLTQDEYLRAICTHKDAKTGNITLVFDDQTQEATCTICGEHFHLLELDDQFTMADIENICESFNDVVNSIKTMYGAIPQEVGRQIFMICGFIKKMPEMFKEGFDYFRKIGLANGLQPNRFNSDQAINMFYSMMTPAGVPINPGMVGPQTFNPAFNQNGQMAQVADMQNNPQYMQYAQQVAQQQQAMQVNPATAKMAQQAFAAQPGMYGFGANMIQGNGPVANYGAAVGGNAAGYVDPTTVAAPMTTDKQTVKSPDVKGGFKG